jgi:hypothetical protein
MRLFIWSNKSNNHPYKWTAIAPLFVKVAIYPIIKNLYIELRDEAISAEANLRYDNSIWP